MGSTTGRTARLNVRISPRNKMRLDELRRYEAPGGISEAAFVEQLLNEAFATREDRAINTAEADTGK